MVLNGKRERCPDDGPWQRRETPTRQDAFPAEMHTLMPLADLCALIGPGNCRGPSALKHRFRIHLLHRWLSQFETACEQAECDSPALCSFGH